MTAKIAPRHYQKTVNGYIPVSQAAREEHAKTKLGQIVELRHRRPRNPKHHAKLFALLSILADNTEDFDGADDALLGVKAATGHGRWKKPKRASKEIFYPDSISFENMSQEEFEPFFDQAVAAVMRWWLPVEDNDLREAVEAFQA